VGVKQPKERGKGEERKGLKETEGMKTKSRIWRQREQKRHEEQRGRCETKGAKEERTHNNKKGEENLIGKSF